MRRAATTAMAMSAQGGTAKHHGKEMADVSLTADSFVKDQMKLKANRLIFLFYAHMCM